MNGGVRSSLMPLTEIPLDHYREHGWLAPIDVMSEAEASRCVRFVATTT